MFFSPLTTTRLKRKAWNDLFVCVQCDRAFTNEDNTETSCCYHPRDLEVDDSGNFWADNDESYNEIDTPEMREEYPDGFRWWCCSKSGGKKGCTKENTRLIQLDRS
ncbi:hypothetical protein FVEN_g12373 [Fusarium venenatum]|uniref:C2H2-type domain-containing protein n=1 Tax=Fusarium venenatum TaxID=56646 RepID=A0A2L2TTA1_9HYPO|nr:uncharacterized protein FVRRES_00992 [Fusarium venenatum]KAG8349402.1 hypothetical protein FVEN_g12373 [Fusarium venenatum]KAH7005804.1 hypothetical protein EDB82DRAFT_521778 [Fusarium venenatum]CEI64480.1 unnamed protein product [Fusarium venenatum]